MQNNIHLFFTNTYVCDLGQRPKLLQRPIYFAALELETMTEDERTLLLDTLQTESHDMTCKFADILDSFENFLTQQNTIIDSVAHIKQVLFKVLKIPLLNKEEKSSSLISDLSNATTVENISIIMSKYCSFFNCQLLETVFAHMKYHEGKEVLTRHKGDLAEYAKRRICHFPSGLGIRGFSHAVIAVKLDDMYEGTHIAHLLTFHRKLCELLRVTLSQCPLDGLKPGCKNVTIHLLDHLVKDTFPLSTDQQTALQSLTCNGSKLKSLTCESFTYILADGRLASTVEPDSYKTLGKRVYLYISLKCSDSDCLCKLINLYEKHNMCTTCRLRMIQCLLSILTLSTF